LCDIGRWSNPRVI
jgi:hypothetical protein